MYLKSYRGGSRLLFSDQTTAVCSPLAPQRDCQCLAAFSSTYTYCVRTTILFVYTIFLCATSVLGPSSQPDPRSKDFRYILDYRPGCHLHTCLIVQALSLPSLRPEWMVDIDSPAPAWPNALRKLPFGGVCRVGQISDRSPTLSSSGVGGQCVPPPSLAPRNRGCDRI